MPNQYPLFALAPAHALSSYVLAGLVAGLVAGCDPQFLGDLLSNPGSAGGTGNPGGTSGGGGDPGPGSGIAGNPGTAGSGGGSGGPQGCHCSRRPGRLQSFQCPPGYDDSVSAVIGPAGGTLNLVGEQGRGVSLQLEIPRGALTEDTKITVTELSAPPPEGYVDYSPVYRFEPVALQLQRPARIRMPWSNLSGEVSSSLTIYWSNGASAPYAGLPDNYRNAGFNQASVTHFGQGFVGYPLAEDPAHCH